MDRKILRTREVSELTGIPEGTLRWWRATSQGPKSFTLGKRRVVYDAADLARWIEDSRAESDKKATA